MRKLLLCIALVSNAQMATCLADVITDWNATMRQAIQLDRTKPDPGWSSRAMAMVNGAIYDSLMAIEPTHQPFLVDTSAPLGASPEAAAVQAASQVAVTVYPGQVSLFDATRTSSLGLIPDGAGKTMGIDLGTQVANQYIAWRAGDGADAVLPYSPGIGPGQWRPDPMNPTQQVWGPAWGSVAPFTLTSGLQFRPRPAPAMTSQEYTDAYNKVKSLGALNSAERTPEQTEIALFWAYDRPGMGPPPVLYNQAVSEIALAQGNSLSDNARLFAMTMMAQADAGVAAWDAKYVDNYWRPIAAIREADTDGNPLTEADPNWIPLGAPGDESLADFTPPFPAYVSGHATFGAAVFSSLAHFYGTDQMHFSLSSGELPGVVRSFDRFSVASTENARSRIYMGIHWNFDDSEGRALGGQIADWVSANHFAVVPEPSTEALLGIGGFVVLLWSACRRS